MNTLHQITVTSNEDEDCLKPVKYIVQNFKTYGYFKPKMHKALGSALITTLKNHPKIKQKKSPKNNPTTTKNHTPNPNTPIN